MLALEVGLKEEGHEVTDLKLHRGRPVTTCVHLEVEGCMKVGRTGLQAAVIHRLQVIWLADMHQLDI